jgi:mRNA interferase MazF
MPSSLQSSATRMPERGEIWLANLNPRRGTEPGKSRPVLIVQAQALLDEGHPSTLIVPLTTDLIDEVAPLRIRVSAREDLRHDSDLLIDQLRAIDNKRLTEGPLARLDSESMRRVGQALLEVLDLTAIPDSTTILDPTN